MGGKLSQGHLVEVDNQAWQWKCTPVSSFNHEIRRNLYWNCEQVSRKMNQGQSRIRAQFGGRMFLREGKFP